MRPLVSVLTPVFGHAEYLGEMLRSLQAQTMPFWECAVVIDGPDDEAERVASIYSAEDPRIAVYALPERVGLPAARNLCARHTKAEWLLPFDADDVMDPCLLASLLNTAYTYDAPGVVVFTAARCLFPSGRETVYRYPAFNPDTFADQLQVTGAALRRRSLWEALGGWDESWTEGAEDWHFYARAVRLGLLEPVQIPQPMWTYRQHDGHRNSRVGHRAWPRLHAGLREVLAHAV